MKTKYLVVILAFLSCLPLHAQLASVNPAEEAAIVAGNAAINKQVNGEIDAEMKTTALQLKMSSQFTKMKNWEKQYNKYLTDINGFASGIQAATHIYDDGVNLFFTLSDIKNAVANNPEGIAATVAMNNLYMETLSELLSCSRILKNTVAVGGEENMLTGAERVEILWKVEDSLHSLNLKLHQLYLSLRHYRLTDVWSRATSGIIEKDFSTIGNESLERFQRAAREVTMYSTK